MRRSSAWVRIGLAALALGAALAGACVPRDCTGFKVEPKPTEHQKATEGVVEPE